MKSEFVQETLNIIQDSIQNEKFTDVEKAKVELKDLSTGSNWHSLKETICAFLNTDGGIIVCGIREKNNKYIYSGINRKNESNFIELQNSFTDDQDQKLDLSENIYFDYESISQGEVLIIAVIPLSLDRKFVKFEGTYYERKLTQDKKIPSSKVQHQKEYKTEIEYAKELSILKDAKLSDLSLDKINYYVNLLNREIRSETLKPSLAKAKPFLAKQHFIKNDEITTLGMLVCGEDPFHFLSNRVEVDCYFDTSEDIAKDKKIFRNDVINLMEDTFRYIWGHIRINRTIKEGGKSVPEYSERLVRETINNALAHRDYTLDSFVTVTVEPNQFIEIKNPGSFKEKIKLVHTETDVPIRRLIPGIPESKNPKLASVLKVYDKIENQGRGMASLVNSCLDNQIDLPFYDLKDHTISLTIPTGELVDEAMENWLSGFEYYIQNKLKDILTFEHKAILSYFYKSEILNKKRKFTILLSEGNNHFLIIESLLKTGLIIEHVSSSEENPVYILDRVLMKTDFSDELINILGNDYITYDSVVKEILNLTYLFTNFNQKALKAAELTPEIYRRIYGKAIDAKKYETLGRKVRSACNVLVGNGILLKDAKSAYKFSDDFHASTTLFN